VRKEWEVVPISQIARKVSRPERVDSSEVYRLLGAHWYAKGLYVKDEKPGMEIRASKLFAVKLGDFVYNRLFAWKGSFAVVEKEHEGCFVSNEFPCFELDRERVIPKFLWLYFSRESAWLEALGLSSGSTPTSRNRLKEGQFLQMQIPLPPPLNEQRRIVARIEELAALIEEARGLRVKAREEAEALLATAIRQIFDASQELPAQWRWVTVSDIGNKERDAVQTGPFGAQLSSSEFTRDGVPVLAIGNVQWGYLDTRDLKCVSEEKAGQLSRYRVQPGDILFARMGTVGRSCVVPDFAKDWLISYHLIKIAVDRSACDPQFVFYALRGSPSVLEAIEEKTRGSTRAGVNSTILRELEFPLPPLAEQRRIVAYLDGVQAQVNELTALQDATQPELDALLPSILDKAFKGEL
jgi:type I restriction enzyme S subunit